MPQTEWDHPPDKKLNIVYLNSGAPSWRMLWLSDQIFAQINTNTILFFFFFFFFFFMCVCFCFVVNVAVSAWLPSVWTHISVWLLSVWQLSMWMRSYDRQLLIIWPICIIIICMDAHQHVITDYDHVWQYQCMYYIQSYFFYYSNNSYCIFLELK